MKRLILFLVLALAPKIAVAQESVTVPWSEFKQLYRESVEREIRKQAGPTADGEESWIHSVDEVAYRLWISEKNARGEVRLSGRVVSGRPRPIPLFGKDLIVSGVSETVGGNLVCGDRPEGRILFLPEGDAKEFRLALTFLTRVHEENGARAIAFEIPGALRNTLQLEMPPGARLLEAPGIEGTDGARHFSSPSPFVVRFIAKETLAAEILEIDTLSRIRVQGNRAVVTAWFVPVQSLSGSFILKASEGAQYVASSLSASHIKKRENDTYEVTAASNGGAAFWLRFSIERNAEGDGFSFTLPRIDKNNGSEGNFILEEPPDGRIVPADSEVLARIPASRLGKELSPAVGADRFILRVSPGKPIAFRVARFQTVSTPPIVLESLSFFTSFEENGNSLSTLVMDVPPEAGPRLKLPAIENATIWSLAVNGEKKKVYADGDGAWIIQLAENKTSRLELALLRRGEPLGLRGRLEAILPETGLPSRVVRVGIALPERVQILSLEGPVSPSPGESWEIPDEFIGKPHYFSRSFHKGEEMKLAVSYKEPVKQITKEGSR